MENIQVDKNSSSKNQEKYEISSLLKIMSHKKASDMFITVGYPPTIKINGHFELMTTEPLNAERSKSLVLSVMNDKQKKEFGETHESNFAINMKRVGRFRVSAFIQRNQAGMVIRSIETHIPSVEQLKLPEIMKELILSKRGIVLFVGGTGTGKSTTLASLINYRNENSEGHIITIEDPIEYIYEHKKSIITQREVGVDTDSWDNALKNTLRQAPDVIMIGEVRTQKTMEHAIAFAETGHLVLCTLHANNADQAFDRIINFFPDEKKKQILMDLSLNVRGIVAQRLIPSVDNKSRCLSMEILLGTPLMRENIKKGNISKLKNIMKSSNNLGMITFDQSLLNLYKQHKISYENAIKFADSANEVRLQIKLNNKSQTISSQGKGKDKNNKANSFLSSQKNDADLFESSMEQFTLEDKDD